MHTGIKKEKSELSIITSNLNNRKPSYVNNKTSIMRPDTLEIRKKPDSMTNLTVKSQENVNWNSDNIDNFITHFKNVNNTPSPITPTSFFNPSDVTQDQEQFADKLTVHLNKIKEEYKSSIESTESNYVNNVLQLSGNDDRPLQITTVSVGNKVYVLNQIHTNTIDESSNVNYGLLDLPNGIFPPTTDVGNNGITNTNNMGVMNPNNTVILQKNAPQNNLSQQLKISNIASLRPQCGAVSAPNIVFSSPNMQQFQNEGPIYTGGLTTVLPASTDTGLTNQVHSTTTTASNELLQPVNIIKTSDGLLYTRIPDASQNQLISHLNTLSNSIAGRQPPSNLKPMVNMEPSNQHISMATDNRCMSVNSSGTTESSNGTVVPKKEPTYSVNNSRLGVIKDDKEMDEQQRRLERKRARNRDAARKCRDRKNTLINNLEQKYAKQCAEKEIIREKLLKSLEEIRRLTDYIAKLDPDSDYSSYNNFLQEIKIHELAETDLKELNCLS